MFLGFNTKFVEISPIEPNFFSVVDQEGERSGLLFWKSTAFSLATLDTTLDLLLHSILTDPNKVWRDSIEIYLSNIKKSWWETYDPLTPSIAILPMSTDLIKANFPTQIKHSAFYFESVKLLKRFSDRPPILLGIFSIHGCEVCAKPLAKQCHQTFCKAHRHLSQKERKRAKIAMAKLRKKR